MFRACPCQLSADRGNNRSLNEKKWTTASLTSLTLHLSVHAMLALKHPKFCSTLSERRRQQPSKSRIVRVFLHCISILLHFIVQRFLRCSILCRYRASDGANVGLGGGGGDGVSGLLRTV